MPSVLYAQSNSRLIVPGDRVIARHSPIGVDHEGIEWGLDPNSPGFVDSITAEGEVNVIYWIDTERHIVQVYSERDGDLDRIAYLGGAPVRASA